MKNISVFELRKILPSSEKYTVVDVRMSERYAAGHMTQAINIPLEEIERRADELKEYNKVYVYCQSGNKSQLACALLESRGCLNAINVEGGISEWERLGFETERL